MMKGLNNEKTTRTHLLLRAISRHSSRLNSPPSTSNEIWTLVQVNIQL